MNWQRVWALVLRYTYLHRRSLLRWLEMFFWPMMDLLMWGFLSAYLRGASSHLQWPITFLIGSMIFWDILFRAQQGVTISFLEDIWSRNLLNIFVAPVRVSEFVAATYIVGLLKTIVISLVLAALALGLYQFNLFQLGLALIPLFANLILMGWALGLVTTGLILRWGQAAEALAWGVPFLIQPLAAVFYPVAALPKWLQPVALCIPATHVFEGMREVLANHAFPTHRLLAAFGLNFLYFAAAGLFFRYMYNTARKKGLLAKLGTQ